MWRIGEVRGVYRVLVGKPDGKRPLGRPRCRWVDNIRMDLQEVVCGYMDWIGLAQDRDRWWMFASAVMNLEMRGISWLAANQLASQEGLCTVEWVSTAVTRSGTKFQPCHSQCISRSCSVSLLTLQRLQIGPKDHNCFYIEEIQWNVTAGLTAVSRVDVEMCWSINGRNNGESIYIKSGAYRVTRLGCGHGLTNSRQLIFLWVLSMGLVISHPSGT